MPASEITRASARALLVGCALVSLSGCRRDEAPEPLPLIASSATSQAQNPRTASSAAPDHAKAPITLAKACCDALASDAKAAPEPTTAYLKQAAAACYASIAQGKDKQGMVRILRGSLGGGSLPAACK